MGPGTFYRIEKYYSVVDLWHLEFGAYAQNEGKNGSKWPKKPQNFA